MKKFSSFFLLALCATVSLHAEAKWERIYELSDCMGLHVVDSTGTIIVSDFKTKLNGGIYYSDDKGKTWKKTKVKDHNYNKFVSTDEYLFALGYGGYIARSNDAGHTWEVLSYRKAIEGIVKTEDMDYTAAYGMIQVPNGRIYLADYCGGVIYSTDYGETWTHTSDEIFIEEEESKEKGEVVKTHAVLYDIEYISTKILAFGLYNVYSYNANTNKWTIVRYDSNLMSIGCKHKKALYMGRAMPNDSYEAAFLERTATGSIWKKTGRPDTKDNNVRSLASNDSLLVVGLQSTGIYVSADDGTSWEEVDINSIPYRFTGFEEENDARLCPYTIDFDKDYIYVAFYDEEWRVSAYGNKPGVYRYPIKALVPTGVESVGVGVSNGDERIFNLAGQRIITPKKGEIYIINGKKVLF